jgi:superfamily II DNA or RNA helicase
MKLRGYQQELVAGSLDLWRAGRRRIAMVMATGGGKTPTAMTIADLSLAAGLPVLWIAHRTELIDQALDKARQVAPGRRIGRLQGRTKQYNAELVVGSVQTASTASTMALLKTRRWGLIVIDETHHATADTYMRVLRELGAYEPDGPLVLGVTATLDRSDGQALGQVFEAVVEPRIGLIDLIRHPEGPYLVPPRGIRVKIADLDLGRVKRVAGDFNSGALGAAMSAAMAPQRIVEAYTEHAKGRPAVAFLPTVAISIEQAQAFNDAGYVAVHLDGTTPAGEREAALERFRRGEIDVLCNVGLFTEGTDLPSIACVILGRPTSSTSLYQQMVGRGLRLHPGKRDCIILDVTGVTGRHKLATLVSLAGADGPEDIPDDLLLYEDDEAEAPLDELDLSAGDDAASEGEAPEYVDGDTVHMMVDLFGQSHSSWLRTDGGVWFLASAQGFVYLHPTSAERYNLAYYAHGSGKSGTIRDDMTIEYAMTAGDEYVTGIPMWQMDRDAAWRKERARGRRGRTRGEVYDEQQQRHATAVLDKIVKESRGQG